MISTFGMKDGIESYTEELCSALKRHHVKIRKCAIKSSIFHLYLISEAIKSKADIIHIQHEYSIFKPRPFGFTILIPLILLRMLQRKIVVTLHTVYPIREFESYIPPKYRRYNCILKWLAKIIFLTITKLIGKLSHHIIVLTPIGVKILKNDYGIFNAKFIPYGIHESKIYDAEYAKQRLGLSNKTVLFCFGYPYPNKGFQYAIEALNELVKRNFDKIILILQDTRPAYEYQKCEEYANMLKDLVRKKDLARYVYFIPFLPEERLSLYLSATDIFIYPFEYRVAFSSSVMKTLYFRVPHIISDIPAFEILKSMNLEYVKFVKPQSPTEISKAIIEVLNNSDKFTRSVERMHASFNEFDWKNIAKTHIKLYTSAH